MLNNVRATIFGMTIADGYAKLLHVLQYWPTTTYVYRVVQKSEATTFEGSDLCMATPSKCPNVYDKFYEYGVNRCIQNMTALK